MNGENITPIQSYYTEDESGSYNLDVYSDGSYGYYGLLYDEVIVTPPEGTVNPRGTGLYGIGSEPVEGAGYTTYENLRPFWSSGSTPSGVYQYMYFYMDYKMQKSGGSYSGSITWVGNSAAKASAAQSLALCSFVSQGVTKTSSKATQTAYLYDEDNVVIDRCYLYATLKSTSYIPTVTASQ